MVIRGLKSTNVYIYSLTIILRQKGGYNFVSVIEYYNVLYLIPNTKLAKLSRLGGDVGNPGHIFYVATLNNTTAEPRYKEPYAITR